MQEQLTPFHMFTWKMVYYYCLKSGTKWFGKNNHDGPFSTLLCIGHMTSGSVIWPMCNITTLLHKGKKQVIWWWGWLFLAFLKLIKLRTCWQGFPNWRGAREPVCSPPFLQRGWGVEPPTRFSKRELERTLAFRGGLLGKREVTEELQFSHKV